MTWFCSASTFDGAIARLAVSGVLCSKTTYFVRWVLWGEFINAIFPLPHVFPPPPFPLEREPTASAPRGDTLSTRIDEHRPLVMSLRFVRRLRNRMAQLLVLYVKLGVRFSRRLAARTLNKHIPLISAP